MISTWRFKGHALLSVGSKRNHTSIRTLEQRSSLSEIRTDITLRSVRCLQAEISMAAAEIQEPTDEHCLLQPLLREFSFELGFGRSANSRSRRLIHASSARCNPCQILVSPRSGYKSRAGSRGLGLAEADLLRAYVFVEFRFLHSQCWLFSGPT